MLLWLRKRKIAASLVIIAGEVNYTPMGGRLEAVMVNLKSVEQRIEYLSDDERDLGKRISTLVEKSGVSYREIATILGQSYDTVKKLGQGKSVKQWVKLAKLADLLGVTPNEMLGYQTPQMDRLGAVLAASYAALGLSDAAAKGHAHIVLRLLSDRQSLEAIEAAQTSARFQSDLVSQIFRLGPHPK
jgi:transcriptional regulator with XRE-family HTH domain